MLQVLRRLRRARLSGVAHQWPQLAQMHCHTVATGALLTQHLGAAL